MSLYSCSTIPSPGSESSNSYRLLSSSSITTVTSPSNNIRDLIVDDERCPGEENLVQNNWRIEKNISLKDQQWNKSGCILKATMTKEQILVSDSSSNQSTIIPGKHISMKVVFNF